MEGGLPVLSTKTLPTALALPSNALRPADVDLAALTSPPDASDSKLSLYRTGAAPDCVWEWTPPPPPAPPPTGKFGGLGLKGKAKAQPAGKVGRIAWNPQGDILAVLVSPPSCSASSPSTLSLLSIHTGTPLLPPASPLPGSSTPSSLAWQHLPLAHDPLLPSWALRLIDRLPALPAIPKEGLPAAGAAGGPVTFGTGASGAPGGGGGGGGGAGVFGAKQAMLERERAKEAQRALSVQEAAERFPTLLPAARAEEDGASEGGDPKLRAMLRLREEGDEGDAVEHTVLCVGDEKGGTHLYLGGSVYLGSVDVGGPVLSVTAVPSPSASASFAIHHSTPTSPLSIRQLSLPLPATLSTILRQSSALRALLQHSFDALQDARNLWDEARRIGKGWLQRIADVSRPHGVTTAPATQLHLLLLTGRPTRALHDFLASKMNERGLVKWEQAMGLALERLRRVGWMSVAPAMERVVLLLREVDAWARWPDKCAVYGFAREDVLRATELAKAAIRVSARLQREVEEEERCFKQFSIWLHYELDKVAQQEGSEVLPLAAFNPLPVSHYIQHRLPPSAVTLAPFLSFGLASAPLKDNKDVKDAEAWVAQLPVGTRSLRDEELELGVAGVVPQADEERLDVLLRRMAEELQGQIDADDLATTSSSATDTVYSTHTPFPHRPHALGTPTDVDLPIGPSPFAAAAADPDAAPRPPASAATTTSARATAPQSLPALLHLAARLVGGTMDRAVRAATGAQAHLGEAVDRAMSLGASEGELRLRTRVGRGGGLEEVWVCGTTITFVRQLAGRGVDEVETAAHKLETSEGAVLRVVEFDFGHHSEVLLGVEAVKEGAPSQYFVARVDTDALEWSASRQPAATLLPVAREHPLDPAFPPAALSLRTTASGRQLVASLGGEGRRLEVLDAAVDPVLSQGMEA